MYCMELTGSIMSLSSVINSISWSRLSKSPMSAVGEERGREEGREGGRGRGGEKQEGKREGGRE